MHIEFRHLRTDQGNSRGRWSGARGRDTAHHTIGAEPSGQGTGRTGGRRTVRAALRSRCGCLRRACVCCGWRIRSCLRSRRWPPSFPRCVTGLRGRMHIAIECHACFEWLFPVLEQFRKDWPDVDVDIRPGLAFDALPALTKEEVDLVVSSDPEDLPGVEFVELFDYAPVFVASRQHPLAKKEYVTADDFRGQTLITYPVERSRLDVFSQLLIPAKGRARCGAAGGTDGRHIVAGCLESGGCRSCRTGLCGR